MRLNTKSELNYEKETTKNVQDCENDQIHTCPREAAAIGSGEISEKMSSKGKPSSFSIVLKATSVENGLI